MGIVERLRPGRKWMWAGALSAALLLAWGAFSGTVAHADDVTQMSVSASGPDVSCSADVCTVEPGSAFTLTVSADQAPEGGYLLVQSFVDYGTSLTYNATEDRADELLWPDLGPSEVFFRAEIAPGTVFHGGLTGLIPPLPFSTYEGPLFEFSLTCTDDFSQSEVKLLPSGDPLALTNGARFDTLVGTNLVEITPKVNSIIVNCGEAPEVPEPPDDVDDVDGVDGVDDVDDPAVDALPPTGTGSAGSGSGPAFVGLWITIAALAIAGFAGLGLGGWRAARAR